MELSKMEPIVKRFYEGVAKGEYWGRKCPECGAIEFPPHLMCNTCGNRDTEWVQLSGHGKLLSLVLPGIQNNKPYLKAEGKYGYGAVQMDARRRRQGKPEEVAAFPLIDQPTGRGARTSRPSRKDLP